MTDKHTPGPWTAESEYEGDARTFVHAAGRPIADCANGYGAEDEANARLTAAATELYGVAKQLDMLWAVEWSSPEEAEQILRKLIADVGDTARAAVAKVRGQ